MCNKDSVVLIPLQEDEAYQMSMGDKRGVEINPTVRTNTLVESPAVLILQNELLYVSPFCKEKEEMMCIIIVTVL
jgi:hypothetical protein